MERRQLNEQICENKLKKERMEFRIGNKETKVTKCEQDNDQIQKHIDLRRMERENKQDLIEQLKREIVHA